ncbi:MAG: zf-HC2 domain-containing protein [Candidatus Eremiobacteraeota bacterium]|nr:zf-HC2 domain-containing protein [Candidatus Eremiobacteraeota bacterium]
MRCETSENLFESLLDGTLAPRRRRELESHLEKCARCSSVLEELRVVDALLLTPRRLEPAVNFTYKVMAEARTLPRPVAPRFRWPSLLAIYLGLSWIAIAGWFFYGRPDAVAMLTGALGALQHVAGALDGFARVAATGFGFGFAGLAGALGILLAADLVLLFAVFFVRRYVATRLAPLFVRTEAG